ncbi:hypothetical protein KTF56_03930 [Burkholderia gladioli]|uniref:hypothetical protein n=1 Tax=Burkholderia gladioli TaxID=28095 RepID=UPI001C22D060|nr:hypothetical protein [Burkholderia gladioli]MBU9682014.1 hypothetical protein [Burkholderia gladioli]
MTVIVSGRLQQGLGSLSEPSRIALAFVDGGIEWLAWAIASPSARYEFSDETHLLDGVQRGLHASPLTLLPTLQLLVSPVKLLTLSLADLRALAIVEAGDDSDLAVSRSRAVLDAHHLLPREELATGTGWLAQLGVETAPLFQALDLDGSLALAALGQLPELAGHAEYLQREAAAFGIEMARTPQEFCDYFRLYLDRVDGLGNHAATNAAQRRDAARTAVQTLLPLLFGALDCPQVGGLVGPSAVAAAVQAWLRQGRMLGFARLSRGAQQMVRHGGYRDQAAHEARHLVEHYLAAAGELLAANPVERGVMGQDGATCSFRIEHGARQAVLQLAPDGVVSLSAFHPGAVG